MAPTDTSPADPAADPPVDPSADPSTNPPANPDPSAASDAERTVAVAGGGIGGGAGAKIVVFLVLGLVLLGFIGWPLLGPSAPDPVKAVEKVKTAPAAPKLTQKKAVNKVAKAAPVVVVRQQETVTAPSQLDKTRSSLTAGARATPRPDPKILDRQKILEARRQRFGANSVVFDRGRKSRQSDQDDTLDRLVRKVNKSLAPAVTPTLAPNGNTLGQPPPVSTRSQSTKKDGFLEELRGQAVKARRLKQLHVTVLQGGIIDATLETAIQSDLPGFIRAVVGHDVYSFTGERILFPAGSRLVGRYQSGLSEGQARVFVIWDRVITPAGIDVHLSSPGVDHLGRAGAGGTVDSHFWRRFSSAAMLSLIGAGGSAALQGASTQAASDVYESFKSAAAISLERLITIPPTIHVDQGTALRVFIARDLIFG